MGVGEPVNWPITIINRWWRGWAGGGATDMFCLASSFFLYLRCKVWLRVYQASRLGGWWSYRATSRSWSRSVTTWSWRAGFYRPMKVDRRPPAHVCAGSTTINERSSTSTEGRTRTGDTGAYRGGPGDWVTRDIKKSWMSSELFGARFSCIITLLCSHLGLLISYLHVCMNVGVCGYVASRLNSARPPPKDNPEYALGGIWVDLFPFNPTRPS